MAKSEGHISLRSCRPAYKGWIIRRYTLHHKNHDSHTRWAYCPSETCMVARYKSKSAYMYQPYHPYLGLKSFSQSRLITRSCPLLPPFPGTTCALPVSSWAIAFRNITRERPSLSFTLKISPFVCASTASLDTAKSNSAKLAFQLA